VDQRPTRIEIETERYRLTGSVRLPDEGYQSRLSDYLNSGERNFLALTDVEIAPLEGSGPVQKRSFIALSVAHVVLVSPADEGAG
jgi:hypothetical protein